MDLKSVNFRSGNSNSGEKDGGSFGAKNDGSANNGVVHSNVLKRPIKIIKIETPNKKRITIDLTTSPSSSQSQSSSPSSQSPREIPPSPPLGVPPLSPKVSVGGGLKTSPKIIIKPEPSKIKTPPQPLPPIKKAPPTPPPPPKKRVVIKPETNPSSPSTSPRLSSSTSPLISPLTSTSTSGSPTTRTISIKKPLLTRTYSTPFATSSSSSSSSMWSPKLEGTEGEFKHSILAKSNSAPSNVETGAFIKDEAINLILGEDGADDIDISLDSGPQLPPKVIKNAKPDQVTDKIYRAIARKYESVLTEIRIEEKKAAEMKSIPRDLNSYVRFMLHSMNIKHLFSHQVEARNHVLLNKADLVLTTPTSSGKSLCFSVPIFESLIANRSHSALFLFPLNALANDQEEKLKKMNSFLPPDKKLRIIVLNGSIAMEDRKKLFKVNYSNSTQNTEESKPPQMLLTNPDILHYQILRGNGNSTDWQGWRNFLRMLKFIVIDEAHTYCGALGSHVANLIRRLLCAVNDVSGDAESIQFVISTATVGNAVEMSCNLIPKYYYERSALIPVDNDSEPEKLKVVAKSGAAIHERTFFVLSHQEHPLKRAAEIIKDVVKTKLRGVVFLNSISAINSLDFLIKENKQFRKISSRIRCFYSSLSQETKIETIKELKTGKCQVILCTSALEAGIDIPEIEVCMVIGFPGSRMSFWQRVGRAGRSKPGLVVYIPSSYSPLDVYYSTHTEMLFDRTKFEYVSFNPDLFFIRDKHLKCAIIETGLTDPSVDVYFGVGARDFVLSLKSEKLIALAHVKGALKWSFLKKVKNNEHGEISIRGTSDESIRAIYRKNQKVLELISEKQALDRLFPGAIFVDRDINIESRKLMSTELDLDKKFAIVDDIPPTDPSSEPGYSVRPIKHINAKILKLFSEHRFRINHPGLSLFAELQLKYGWGKITTSVVGKEITITKRDKKTITTENFEDGKFYRLSYEAPCIEFTVTDVATKFLDSHLLTQLTNCARSPEESERMSTVLGHSGSFVAIHTLIHQLVRVVPFCLLSNSDLDEADNGPGHPQILVDSVPQGSGACDAIIHRFLELCEKAQQLTSSCSACHSSPMGCAMCIFTPSCRCNNEPVLTMMGLDLLNLSLVKQVKEEQTEPISTTDELSDEALEKFITDNPAYFGNS